MKLSIEKFGPIQDRVLIEPKPLTVFCGANNTGKTYVLYVLNALLDSRFVATFPKAEHYAQQFIAHHHQLDISFSELLDQVALKEANTAVSNELKNTLPSFFNIHPEKIENSLFNVEIEEKDVKNKRWHSLILQSIHGCTVNITKNETGFHIAILPSSETVEVSLMTDIVNRVLTNIYLINQNNTLLLPAERAGLSLFFREINFHRSQLISRATSGINDTSSLIRELNQLRYARPIRDYIDFMGSQVEVKKKSSHQFSDLAAQLQKSVLEVRYVVDEQGGISLLPLNAQTDMGLHLGSSTAKSFFGLWAYLHHLAQAGDCLMIDEPELNLHPRNQRAMARLLAVLVNRGIQVVVSTHSDYMLREWGHLVMLSDAFQGRDAVAAQHGLTPAQWLTPDKLAAYEFEAGGVQAMRVDVSSGISTRLFDESIERLNAAAQDIYFARQAHEEDQQAESI